MTYEFPSKPSDWDRTWPFCETGWVMGTDKYWYEAIYTTNVFGMYSSFFNQLFARNRFLSGPGHEISPTRTPWASWWRPWCDTLNQFTVWNFSKKRVASFMYWMTSDDDDEEKHTAFHGPCECGACHELPDVARDNPQGDEYEFVPLPLEIVGTVKVMFADAGPLPPFSGEEVEQ